MPHFVLHCSASLLDRYSKPDVLDAVRGAAQNSALFSPRDIKVRVLSFASDDSLMHEDAEFIHAFGYLKAGRTDAEKAGLSRSVVRALADLMPDVPIVSTNLLEFDDASYVNRGML